MALKGVRAFGTDYAAAERFCDEWAGDNKAHAALVEDFTLGAVNDRDAGGFLVMDYEAALAYTGRNDAKIQYDADHTESGPASWV